MVEETLLFIDEERYPIDRSLIDPVALPVGDAYGDGLFENYLADYAGVARKYKPKRIFEIGVRYGYIAICMVHGIRKLRGQPNVEYLGIDDESYHRGSNARANENFATVLPGVPMKAMTWNSITQGLPPGIGTFDMIHVDGNHSYPWVLNDLRQVWPILNPGGLVLLDDAAKFDDRGQPGEIYRAIQDFLCERPDEHIAWQYQENERCHVYIQKF